MKTGKITHGFCGPCNGCGKEIFIKLGKKKVCKHCLFINKNPRLHNFMQYVSVIKMSKWGCKPFCIAAHTAVSCNEAVIYANKSIYDMHPSNN